MKPPGRWPPLPDTQEQRDFREHRKGLNRQLRAAWLAGLEEEMLAEMQRFPGDLPEEWPGRGGA